MRFDTLIPLDIPSVALATTSFFFIAGALTALLTFPWPNLNRIMTNIFALFGGLATIALGVMGITGSTLRIHLSNLLPLNDFDLTLDRPGAFFTLLIGCIVVPVSLYAIDYTRVYVQHPRRLAWLNFWFNFFILALVFVSLASNVLTFLLMWEIMSLSSYFLVMTESEDDETRQAGQLYFIMTHAGAACLLTGFLLLTSWTGASDFASWRILLPGLSETERNLAFLLLMVGFATKAGVIPLHIWLPRAHPAAPSHVSALMSGIMVKLGVYGIVRFGFDLLGPGPLWWGIAILLAGMISSILGILLATVERDLKRMLAFSTVENIGIILIGLGASLTFWSAGLKSAAALALIAALYHTLNHGFFKSLLFLGAGIIAQTTHVRNMDLLGGLIKKLPWTSALFLIGVISIAGLPPLNGFISEWLTFQALLLSFQLSSPLLNLLVVFAVAFLALTSGVAVASFVRAFGSTFLASPRSPAAAEAKEASWLMRSALILLAAGCVALGLLPAFILPILNTVMISVMNLPATTTQGGLAGMTRIGVGNFGSVSPPWIAFLLIIILGSIPLILRLLGTNRQTRSYKTWYCGSTQTTSRVEYTATALAYPFKRIFMPLYQPVRRLTIEFTNPQSRFFIKTFTYSNETRLVIEDVLFQPLARFGRRIGQRILILQSGSIHLYLAYILIVLLILLALTR